MDHLDDSHVFEEILNPSELILWTGRPSRLSYLLIGLPGLIFGLFWALFDLFFLVAAIYSGGLSFPVLLFLSLHAFPFYIGVWGFVYRILAHRNVIYAYTDQRLIVREGLLGVDYQTVDYSSMLSMQVKVSPSEHLQNRGSILITTGYHVLLNPRGRMNEVVLTGISHPYQVFRELQIISEGVQADNHQ